MYRRSGRYISQRRSCFGSIFSKAIGTNLSDKPFWRVAKAALRPLCGGNLACRG